MNRTEFIKQLERNYKKGVEIVKRKNQDYAGYTDPFKNFRLVNHLGVCSVEDAILVRMADKFQRIANLLHQDSAVKDESIEDTLIDLMNYANILLVYIQKERNEVIRNERRKGRTKRL